MTLTVPVASLIVFTLHNVHLCQFTLIRTKSAGFHIRPQSNDDARHDAHAICSSVETPISAKASRQPAWGPAYNPVTCGLMLATTHETCTLTGGWQTAPHIYGSHSILTAPKLCPSTRRRPPQWLQTACMFSRCAPWHDLKNPPLLPAEHKSDGIKAWQAHHIFPACRSMCCGIRRSSCVTDPECTRLVA